MDTITTTTSAVLDRNGIPLEITSESATPSDFEEAESALRAFRTRYGHLIDVDRFLTAKKLMKFRKATNPSGSTPRS